MTEEQTHEAAHDEDLAPTEEESEGVSGGALAAATEPGGHTKHAASKGMPFKREDPSEDRF